MSLAIDVDTVTEVLIGDHWYTVKDASFTLDSYEYLWWGPKGRRDDVDPIMMHSGGEYGVCANGFMFCTNQDACMYGPLTSIQAVKTTAHGKG